MLVDPVADNEGNSPTKGGSYESQAVVHGACHLSAHRRARARWEHAGFRLTLTMPPPTSLGGEFPSRHAP